MADDERKEPESLWQIATREEVDDLRRLVNETAKANGVNAVAIAELSKWMRHELTMRDNERNADRQTVNEALAMAHDAKRDVAKLRDEMAAMARRFDERVGGLDTRLSRLDMLAFERILELESRELTIRMRLDAIENPKPKKDPRFCEHCNGLLPLRWPDRRDHLDDCGRRADAKSAPDETPHSADSDLIGQPPDDDDGWVRCGHCSASWNSASGAQVSNWIHDDGCPAKSGEVPFPVNDPVKSWRESNDAMISEAEARGAKREREEILTVIGGKDIKNHTVAMETYTKIKEVIRARGDGGAK